MNSIVLLDRMPEALARNITDKISLDMLTPWANGFSSFGVTIQKSQANSKERNFLGEQDCERRDNMTYE